MAGNASNKPPIRMATNDPGTHEFRPCAEDGCQAAILVAKTDPTPADKVRCGLHRNIWEDPQ